MIIANPIYDVVFKRLMEDTENARFFIETLLEQDIESIQFKPQEYTHVSLDERLTFFRLDFIATIRTAEGDNKKVLVEIQKGKKSMDVMRFRNYLAEHYKREDDIETTDGTQKAALPIFTIYILGFELTRIPTPAVKIAREYVDLVTKETLPLKHDFIEQLTHDCIIVQTPRIHGPIKTQLDQLLSIFEQNYFIDGNETLKAYNEPIDNESIRRMTTTLSYVASDEDGRRSIEAEESLRRILDGNQNEDMVKLRLERKKLIEKYELVLVENEQIREEKERERKEKEQVLAEKEQVLAEKDKQIAELLAKLNNGKQ